MNPVSRFILSFSHIFTVCNKRSLSHGFSLLLFPPFCPLSTYFAEKKSRFGRFSFVVRDKNIILASRELRIPCYSRLLVLLLGKQELSGCRGSRTIFKVKLHRMLLRWPGWKASLASWWSSLREFLHSRTRIEIFSRRVKPVISGSDESSLFVLLVSRIETLFRGNNAASQTTGSWFSELSI